MPRGQVEVVEDLALLVEDELKLHRVRRGPDAKIPILVHVFQTPVAVLGGKLSRVEREPGSADHHMHRCFAIQSTVPLVNGASSLVRMLMAHL